MIEFTAPPLAMDGDDNFGVDRVVGMDDAKKYVEYANRKDENLLLPWREGSPRVKISGQGRISDHMCGKPKAWYRSILLSKLRTAFYTCGHQKCPLCFRYWAARFASRTAAYIDAIVREDGTQYHHWTWSPSKEWIDRYGMDFKRMKREAREWMERWHDPSGGNLGWLVVLHPARIKCGNPSIDGSGRQYCDASPETHKLPSVCPSCQSPSRWQWVYSPHLHFITNFQYRYADRRYAMLALRRFGYAKVAKDITLARRGAPLRGDELARTIAYELGHALWTEGRVRGGGGKGLTMAGALHNGRYKRVDVEQLVRYRDEDSDEYAMHEVDELPGGGYSCDKEPKFIVRDGEYVYMQKALHFCFLYRDVESMRPEHRKMYEFKHRPRGEPMENYEFYWECVRAKRTWYAQHRHRDDGCEPWKKAMVDQRSYVATRVRKTGEIVDVYSRSLPPVPVRIDPDVIDDFIRGGK